MANKALRKAEIEELAKFGKFAIGRAKVNSLTLAPKNARFLESRMFGQLVENIKEDAQLSSVPFVYVSQDTGAGIVLSGNHRVKAARTAGVEEIPIMYNLVDMSEDEQVALQLSHNSISGKDDMQVLMELYRSIEDNYFREAAFIDESVFEPLDNVDASTMLIQSMDLPSRLITIMFLESDYNLIVGEIERAEKLLDQGTIVLSEHNMYEPFLRVMEAVRLRYGVLNGSIVFRVLIEGYKNYVAGKDEEELFSGATKVDGMVSVRIGGTELSIPEKKVKQLRELATLLASEV